MDAGQTVRTGLVAVRLGDVCLIGQLVAVHCCHRHRDSAVLMGQELAVREMDGMNGCCHSFGFGWCAFDPLGRLGALKALGSAGVCSI